MYYQAGSSKAAGWYRQNHSPDMRTPDRFLCESNDREEWYLCSEEGGKRDRDATDGEGRSHFRSFLSLFALFFFLRTFFARSFLFCFFLPSDPPSDLWEITWDKMWIEYFCCLLISGDSFLTSFLCDFFISPFTTRLYASLFMLPFLFFFSLSVQHIPPLLGARLSSSSKHSSPFLTHIHIRTEKGREWENEMKSRGADAGDVYKHRGRRETHKSHGILMLHSLFGDYVAKSLKTSACIPHSFFWCVFSLLICLLIHTLFPWSQSHHLPSSY